MENKYDAIIIGSGAIGSSCAYELSKRGLKVLVLEKNDACMGTGGATGGLLSWFTKKPGYHLSLFLESNRMFPVIAEEIGDIGYHPEGVIQMIETELEEELVKKSIERDDIPEGFKLEIVDNKGLRELEPFASEALPGALWIPDGARIDVFAFIYALIRAAKRLGAVFMNETPVTGIIKEGCEVKGVRTPAGDFFAPVVINCCGTWGANTASMLGMDLPIKPRRGQMVLLEQSSRFIFHMITSSMYQTIKFHPELITDPLIQKTGYSFGIEQTDAGSTILSCTREFAGFDTGVTIEAIGMLIRGAAKDFPCIKYMRFIRTFSGLRPYTPDGLPIVGQAIGIKGFFNACGHEGDGIALAPVTARIIAQLVTEGRSEYDIAPLSEERFKKN